MNMTEKQLILLVEDDSLLLLTAEETLIDEGFEVVTATSGRLAIDEIEKDSMRFCAVITDIRLGKGQNGWDIGHRVRQLAGTMPVVYMTADSAKEWASQGVPGSVLVQKPFVSAQLIQAVTTLINQAGMVNLGLQAGE